MRFPDPVLAARFVRRYQRFFADVALPDGTVLTAHCANPGSMLGVMPAGAPAYISGATGDGKLRWSLEAVRVGPTWVGVHPVRANRVVEEGLEMGVIRPLQGYARHVREAGIGPGSRADFLLLDDRRPPCWVEVKNVTLAQGRLALFPDSVTERGRRHLQALTARVRAGERGVLLLVASRGDVTRVGPADGIDPAYGRALRDAIQAGVEVFGYRMRVSRRGLVLDRRILLDPGPHSVDRSAWSERGEALGVAPRERST
jgi:sugar fermentation stimulation protein A